MKKLFFLLISTLLISAPYGHAMEKQNILYPYPQAVYIPKLNLAKEFALKIKACVDNVQKYLETTLSNKTPQEIALMVAIEDTCLLSKKTYDWLEKNGLNQVCENFENSFSYDAERSPINIHVRKLVLWALKKGIKIYYFTPCKDKMETQIFTQNNINLLIELGCKNQEGFTNLLPYHRYKLQVTGYPLTSTSIICQKYETYTADPQKVTDWVQIQFNEIKKVHTTVAFLDANPENVDSSVDGQFLFPRRIFI